MPAPFRPEPLLGAEYMKTYAIVRKDGLHYRPASCAEVGCEHWQNGWTTRVPVHSKLAQFIEGETHGRHFTETTGLGEAERTFVFPASQECFRSSQHRKPIEREPFFVVRDGDWRGNPRGTAVVNRTADDWTDDFAEHQAHIADVQQQG